MENFTYRTAESVSPYHPDKLCDQISDAVLDACLKRDPHARVAVETCGGHGEVYVVGEITSKASIPDIETIVSRIAGKNLKVHTNIVEQSPEIARGVDDGGAGDQGIMIGYACNETAEHLPLEVVVARRLNQRIFSRFPFDGKTQVTIKVAEDGSYKLETVVASFQSTKTRELTRLVREILNEFGLPGRPKLLINPAGEWKTGGFDADTGLTGRKLVVDNYGPRIAIGGGCYSGKDPSKVDRSAAYMARRIAVDYLEEREASEVYVRLAYAIGCAEPVERTVIIDGVPEVIPEFKYNLTPAGIIRKLKLRQPIYEQTARYGHFGEGFAWDA